MINYWTERDYSTLGLNGKDRLFGVDAVRQYDECSDYHKTIAEFYSSLVMKFKVFVEQ